MNKKHIILAVFLFAVFNIMAQTSEHYRWRLNGHGGITWHIADNLPHHDHIEMSGKRVSTVVTYGVEADSSFYIKRAVVWPMLRTIPNNTHASLIHEYTRDIADEMTIDGKNEHEKVQEITLNGMINTQSELGNKISFSRIIFPSTEKPAIFEKYVLKNFSEDTVDVNIPKTDDIYVTDAKKGVYGAYTLTYTITKNGSFTLAPGDSLVFGLVIAGKKDGENWEPFNIELELQARKDFIRYLWSNLILETPDSVLNTLFAFSKIRAAESIYQTKGGPMHGPGGLSYYAAIWANDQAEYINPFFPYLGYDYAIKSAINSFMMFARFMNDEYKPIPSSIIAEGTDIWNGAGDRGDAAMIAYGASRFALELGDSAVAEKLWPLIVWTLEYNHRKLNSEGVVASNTDELEGRFPSGKANLNTSSLYYDALNSAYYLGKALGKDPKLLKKYKQEAKTLKKNIENYFGANVMGFDTYRYYKGNKKLRAWICIPLTMGIYDRKEGTIDALFSPELWTEDGLATVSGDKTFWDRATLYGFRGVFSAGDTKKGLEFLEKYSKRRLLGEHVPYPVEAWPEGGQQHLSAESGLYCRIYTEGLFGIRPTGLHSFNLTPQLPEDWDHMRLKKIHGFGEVFDIDVVRKNGDKLKVTVSKENKIFKTFEIRNGETVEVKFE
jgi:hypothetical protein